MPRSLRIAFAAVLAVSGTAPAAVDPSLTPRQVRQETAILARDYVDKSPSFSLAARSRAHQLLGRISADAAKLSGPQYLLALAKVTAQADNGHDGAYVGDSPLRPSTRLPLRMVWIGKRLFVARAGPGLGELPGSEVLRIGRWSPSSFRVLREYQGGTDAFRRWQTSWILHNPALLNASGITASASVTSIEFRLAGGRVMRREIRSIDSKQVPALAFPTEWWSPVASAAERTLGWTAAPTPATPLYLGDPDRLFRTSEMPGQDALYVQFRSNSDGETEKIAPFVAEVAERLRRNPPRNLILDLRFDMGGDNTQNRDLMRFIAQRVPGRIFMITGPYTFSAGIASAAALIHDGGAKVTVVGEDAGDRPHWWSEGRHSCLPFSKACVTRNSGKWDVVNGCAGQPHCFGDQFDLKVASLAPSRKTPLTVADWRAGRDPAMEAILTTLGNPGRR